MACRHESAVTHWVSLDDATSADVEPTLLRLLGECGASRTAIVRAALERGRFGRVLRHELAEGLSDRLLPRAEPHPLAALDHRFVSVDASDVFVRGHGPAVAHSDHLRPETAHLLLSLAAHSR
ncbi:hypothetical protein [Streptomyces sp. CA-179760]|uniref:hypothetical protein n=1 Tax=Streptomyces sp. CA-179760 TaxID=3240054 RepID=UPI003D914BFF